MPPACSHAPRPEWRPGCSSGPPVLDIPAAKALLGRLRHLALPAPRVEPVIDCKAGQTLECKPRRRDGRAIEARLAHSLSHNPDRLFLDQRQLIALRHDLPPLVDLLVDVDLDRAHAGAAAVERRG